MAITSLRESLGQVGGRMTAIVLLALMGFAGWKLANAPLYPNNDAASCEQKYAKARTLAETTTVDFLPHRDSVGRKHRCVVTRGVKFTALTK